MKPHLLITFIAILLAAGCRAGSCTSTPPTMEGLWESEGYGLAMEVTPSAATIYHEAGGKILEWTTSSRSGDGCMSVGGLQVCPRLEGEKLVVAVPAAAPYYCHRIAALPPVLAPTDDPSTNFDFFWSMLNEQYAFFTLRNMDWAAQRATYRPQVTASTTPDQLFEILSGMIAPLRDAHTRIANESTFRSFFVQPDWSSRKNDFIQLLTTKYIADVVYVNVPGAPEGAPLFYGRVGNAIGYLNLPNMSADAQTAAEIMDAFVDKYRDAPGLIIDARFNLGGSDLTTLAYASRLADTERTAFTKRPRYGDEGSFGPATQVTFKPEGAQQFTGPVVLLTSGLTGSAGESFTLALAALPHVTRIGERTAGCLSDILEKSLPNGWNFGLSNEEYRSFDGVLYEGQGIPPDITCPMTLADLDRQEDPALEAAIARLEP